VPAKSAATWNQSDLIRRVLHALDFASRKIEMIVEVGATEGKGSARRDWNLHQKIVAETALLLYCVEPVRGIDERIQKQFESLAALLVPQARHEDVIAALCLEPGLAWDHAVPHILLNRLGFPNRRFDRLLSASLAMGSNFGPERTSVGRLELEWLARLRNAGEPLRYRMSRHLADSMLGRPMDVLDSSRLDIYAFTHAVMYASDFGRCGIQLPRSGLSIAADADAALACSLDSNDFDLTAEVLLTWPMLRLTWSPAATFVESHRAWGSTSGHFPLVERTRSPLCCLRHFSVEHGQQAI
jgi:hypothetical protein